MKFVALFILSFALLSALPFLWNQFSFVKVGFPFTYLEKTNYESPEFTSTTISLIRENLLYDLVIVAIFTLMLTTFLRSGEKSN
ncbi:hypothetical protein CPT03_00800 [Pedobacter ginsengisoli]|uniref:Uncharacterized protein n=1 Tax=Pedobacter ginsengisoli TaxID=363852 RepID=A0A2D1U0J1_9SPHI|nr:hypothetical protein CPT03_00800 [Pedobacter ginsengisoli]